MYTKIKFRKLSLTLRSCVRILKDTIHKIKLCTYKMHSLCVCVSLQSKQCRPAGLLVRSGAALFAIAQNTTKAEFANTIDADETAHHELFHLGLQCFPSSLFYNMIQHELSILLAYFVVRFPDPLRVKLMVLSLNTM